MNPTSTVVLKIAICTASTTASDATFATTYAMNRRPCRRSRSSIGRSLTISRNPVTNPRITMQMLMSESHLNVPPGSMISRSGAAATVSVSASRTIRAVDGSRRWASSFG